MNQVALIWRAHITSNLGALRNDARARVTWLIALAVDLGIGFWSMHSLLDNLAKWQAAGEAILTLHLWLLCAGIWGGIAAFSAIASLQLGFGGDQSLLLMTMPLAPPLRFRALYGLVLGEGIGNWLLLASVVSGVPLIIVLRWTALTWLLLLVTGMAVTAWVALLVTLLVVAFILPNLGRALVFLIVALVIAGIAYKVIAVGLEQMAANVICSGDPCGRHLPIWNSPHLPIGSAWIGGTMCLLVAIGPLAGVAGRLYLRAFQVLEGRVGSDMVVTPPGVRLLSGWAGRWRVPAGAMLYKGLLYQSRSVFTWGRIVILLAMLALFPVVRQVMVANGFSNIAQVVVYASALAALTTIEYAAYAISGEGARLSLFLLAPLTLTAYLRSRLFIFLLPAFAIGLAASPLLGAWAGLSPLQVGMAALLTLLLLGGYMAFLVCGSASDEDIESVAEGRMQTLLQEELPTSPRRLQLLGLSIIVLGLMIALTWKLPLAAALLTMAALDSVIVPVMWRYALKRVQRLLDFHAVD